MFDTLKRINPKILGQKLKQARIARGLRQEDVAETLGVVRTTLVAMEQGSRRVTAKELVALAELYARPLSEWLGEEPAPVPLVPQFRMPADQTHFPKVNFRGSSASWNRLHVTTWSWSE